MSVIFISAIRTAGTADEWSMLAELVWSCATGAVLACGDAYGVVERMARYDNKRWMGVHSAGKSGVRLIYRAHVGRAEPLTNLACTAMCAVLQARYGSRHGPPLRGLQNAGNAQQSAGESPIDAHAVPSEGARNVGWVHR